MISTIFKFYPSRKATLYSFSPPPQITFFLVFEKENIEREEVRCSIYHLLMQFIGIKKELPRFYI